MRPAFIKCYTLNVFCIMFLHSLLGDMVKSPHVRVNKAAFRLISNFLTRPNEVAAQAAKAEGNKSSSSHSCIKCLSF